MKIEISNALWTQLAKHSGRETLSYEDDVYDACGGNYDDAYNIGYDDGAAKLAKQIVEEAKLLD